MGTKRFWDKQHFVLDVDPFKVAVGVCVNCTEAEVTRRMRRRLESDKYLPELLEGVQDWDQADSHGQMFRVRHDFIVLLRLDPKLPRTAASVIAHEMTHVVQYLLRARRTPLTEDTEEVYAYLVEHLVRETLRRLNF